MSPGSSSGPTGALSSFLDNAPTYLTFLALGQGLHLADEVVRVPHTILAAISVGAVFMGANTYIGNAPNFMVKAIAEAARVRMPSFFGYMVYSAGILLPVFAAVTWLFFGRGHPHRADWEVGSCPRLQSGDGARRSEADPASADNPSSAVRALTTAARQLGVARHPRRYDTRRTYRHVETGGRHWGTIPPRWASCRELEPSRVFATTRPPRASPARPGTLSR